MNILTNLCSPLGRATSIPSGSSPLKLFTKFCLTSNFPLSDINYFSILASFPNITQWRVCYLTYRHIKNFSFFTASTFAPRIHTADTPTFSPPPLLLLNMDTHIAYLESPGVGYQSQLALDRIKYLNTSFNLHIFYAQKKKGVTYVI